MPIQDKTAAGSEVRTRFSLVVAAYNVDRYLPQFIESIEGQTYPLDSVELVIVDDGSTDGTLDSLRKWEAQRPELVTVLTKPNGGQGSARNLGLEHAVGDWVSFPDPDDTLHRDYLSAVSKFLDKHGEATDMVATSFVLNFEDTGKLVDHPRKALFDQGDILVDITGQPEYFHGSAPAAFFPRHEIERQNLRFDLRVRPHFEDGHFCALFLLGVERPRVGFVGSATYYYRKRADKSSTLQSALMNPDRFVRSPRFGYLDALRSAEETLGHVPEWLQNLILYELSYYFDSEDRVGGAATAAHGTVADQFVEILGEIASYLDESTIASFGTRPMRGLTREALCHGFGDTDWRMPYVLVSAEDRTAQQQLLSYRYAGDAPTERITIDGDDYAPEDAKHVAHQYWGHTLIRERRAWVPSRGTLRVYLDDEPAYIRATERPREVTSFSRGARKKSRNRGRGKLTLRARAVRKASVQGPVRNRFDSAWVLIDRVHAGDDNAERLFRYLRDNRPDINAWFVIEKGTPDWDRLRSDGYGDRVVAYGSLKWKLLLLNCRHMISSHADQPIVSPTAVTRYRRPEWFFSFLQHGVIKDDISRWLNSKKIDLFVTSTAAEHASITGDDGPYKFTTREVKMTGMPRFDRLQELGERFPMGRRDLVLVCPTWRSWLNTPTPGSPHRRQVSADFLGSEFLKYWMEFFWHDGLREIASRENVEIGFLPHSNMQSVVPELDLPPHVQRLTSEGNDIQELMARSVAFVTDYSSMAFNAAYIDRPTIYYQFDFDLVMGGGHTGRASYFDYRDHGFGPVCETAEATIGELDKIVANGGAGPEYERRMTDTFPARDGKCCERTVQAILDLERRGRA